MSAPLKNGFAKESVQGINPSTGINSVTSKWLKTGQDQWRRLIASRVDQKNTWRLAKQNKDGSGQKAITETYSPSSYVTVHNAMVEFEKQPGEKTKANDAVYFRFQDNDSWDRLHRSGHSMNRQGCPIMLRQ